MADTLPKRRIDELVTRWTLTGLRLIVVEGEFDERVMQLLQGEAHCPDSLKNVDVCAVDSIDVPRELLNRHGIGGSGAKQRVIAFGREVEATNAGEGFRGIVDRDLDIFLALDVRSQTVLYTDYGCLEAYLWPRDVLARLLVQFKAETSLPSVGARRRLYESLLDVCLDVAAVRISSQLNPEWTLELHQSEKALKLSGGSIRLDLNKYVEQCSRRKGVLGPARESVRRVREALNALGPMAVLNGHDLVWLLTYSLRQLTTVSKRLVHDELVTCSMVGLGVMNSDICKSPLFVSISGWAS